MKLRISQLREMIREEVSNLSEKKKKGLWDRIRAKRKRGEKPAQPGDKDYPDEKTWKKLTKESEEVLDEGGNCDGPTKKASSDRKGKKWQQCVKQPDGGYKRIHWGQKGVRVTGDSGNTKRKKSFRARHNCKDAKAGTAKAQACKDW